jgi:DNA-binding transcriptional LysR family regulator
MQWTHRIDRRLNPRDLHLFMVVAEHGNISKAADSLAVSRPVISRMIAGLERTLGVPLFDRSPQGVEPTLYGRALRRLAVTVFDDLRQGMQEIEFLADPTAGELRIGCNESMAAGLLTAAIGRLSQRYPKLIFHMELGTSDVLQLQTLRERRCELVVARQIAPHPDPDMDTEALFHERPLVWVGPRRDTKQGGSEPSETREARDEVRSWPLRTRHLSRPVGPVIGVTPAALANREERRF